MQAAETTRARQSLEDEAPLSGEFLEGTVDSEEALGGSSNPERAEEAIQQGSDEGPSEVVEVQEPETSQVTDASKPSEVDPVTVPGTEHPVVESVLEAVSLEETTGSDTGEKAGSGSQGTSHERSSRGEQ